MEAIKLQAHKMRRAETNRNPNLLCLNHGVFDMETREFRAATLADGLLDTPRLPVSLAGPVDIYQWRELVERVAEWRAADRVREAAELRVAIQAICPQSTMNADERLGD